MTVPYYCAAALWKIREGISQAQVRAGKVIKHDFDWVAKQVVGEDRGDPIKLPLNRGLLDKSTYQIALQQAIESVRQRDSKFGTGPRELSNTNIALQHLVFRITVLIKSGVRPSRLSATLRA